MAHSEYKYVMSDVRQARKLTNTTHATMIHTRACTQCFCILLYGSNARIILTKTIIKSKIVQKLVKYLQKPRASHFKSISTLKITQKTRLVQ